MCRLKDAQCNENVSSFFAIYYFFNCLRCILDRPVETVSVDCQSSNFCPGISKTSRMFLPHYLLGLPLSLFTSIFPFKMIFSKPLLLFKWPKYFYFLRNRTQTAVINIFNFLIFINLTFRMLLNSIFKSTVTVLKTILSSNRSFWILWPILIELHSQKR